MNIRKQGTSHLLSFTPSLVGVKEFANLNQHVVDISVVRERNEKLTRENTKALPYMALSPLRCFHISYLIL